METNKELIIEDVEFIKEYMDVLKSKHPEIKMSTDLLQKIERRLDDIRKRAGA